MPKMNTLPDLNDLLFEQIERINDDDLKGEKLEEQIKKSTMVVNIAGKIIDNSSLLFKAATMEQNNGFHFSRILIGDKSNVNK